MALHRAITEIIKVSGSVFMLFCIASALGLLLLLLLFLSYAVSRIKRARFETDQP